VSTETESNHASLARVKAAQTAQPLHELVATRWSPRAFSAREVTPEQIVALLEAARWAPSCYNDQPWSYIVGRKGDGETFDKLLGALMEANRLWASHAPVLMLSLARRNFTHNGAPNFYALHDAGLALGHMAIQANALGLSLHAMGGFDRAAARAAFAIPDEYELGAAVAVGYAGDPASLPEKYQRPEFAPRSRKPLADLVYSGFSITPPDAR